MTLAAPASAEDLTEQILEESCKGKTNFVFNRASLVGQYNTTRLAFANCGEKTVYTLTCYQATKMRDYLREYAAASDTPASAARIFYDEADEFQRGINAACVFKIS